MALSVTLSSPLPTACTPCTAPKPWRLGIGDRFLRAYTALYCPSHSFTNRCPAVASTADAIVDRQPLPLGLVLLCPAMRAGCRWGSRSMFIRTRRCRAFRVGPSSWGRQCGCSSRRDEGVDAAPGPAMLYRSRHLEATQQRCSNSNTSSGRHRCNTKSTALVPCLRLAGR